MKWSNQKVFWIIAGISVIIPVLIVPIINIGIRFMFYFTSSDWWPEWLKWAYISTDGYAFSLKDYVSNLIIVLQIVITGIFSYAIYMTSIKNNELSEKLVDIENRNHALEQKKDRDRFVESIFILYNEMNENLKTIFEEIKITEKTKTSPIRLNCSSAWKEHLSTFKRGLSENEISRIHEFYCLVERINFIFDNSHKIGTESECRKLTNNLYSKVIERVAEPMIVEHIDNNNHTSALKLDFAILLKKMRLILLKDDVLTLSDFTPISINDNYDQKYFDGEIGCLLRLTKFKFYGNNECIYLNGECGKDGTFNGGRKEYRANGDPLAEIKYSKNRIAEIRVVDRNGKVVIDGTNNEKDEFTGYAEKKYQQYSYHGLYINGVFHGAGKKIGRGHNLIESGEYQNGYLINGKLLNVVLEDDQGNGYYSDKAYEESMIDRMEDPSYNEQMQIEYEEENRGRKIGWENVADVLVVEGVKEVDLSTKKKRNRYEDE